MNVFNNPYPECTREWMPDNEPLYVIMKELCVSLAQYPRPYESKHRLDVEVMAITIEDHANRGRLTHQERRELLKILETKQIAVSNSL